MENSDMSQDDGACNCYRPLTCDLRCIVRLAGQLLSMTATGGPNFPANEVRILMRSRDSDWTR
jgi:hypothetical protein